MKRFLTALGCAALVTAAAANAAAFCGFYVSGADAKLFNNATLVVMMRDGTRTVLSMQNNYEGPPDDFAMVVPVPVVLQESNVKTLPREIFTRIDQLAAPRLVEYWEQDPCAQRRHKEEGSMQRPAAAPMDAAAKTAAAEHGVTIEAQFTVGEYEIVILGAKDSTGLDAWLRDNNYKIPQGAEPVLRPYVEAGMKFFVAKVDAAKVKFEERDGKKMAMLSPLRFHYDADTFNLPVRLGLLNSGGTQDLIVHILARRKRYEVSNFPNTFIPTNLDVAEDARDSFGPFYAALFDKTLENNPGAVVTEYAWDATSCDPCPTPALSPQELATFGADALPDTVEEAKRPRIPQVKIGDVKGPAGPALQVRNMQGQLQGCYQRALRGEPTAQGSLSVEIELDAFGSVEASKITGANKLPGALVSCVRGTFDVGQFNGGEKGVKVTIPLEFASVAAPPQIPFDFVLTRLHARYTKDTLGQDLVFRETEPVQGGREQRKDKKLEQGATKGSGINNFQGRYAIRHAWTGKIECDNPVRGVWGGPPTGGHKPPKPALDLAFVQRGKVELASLLRQDVPELKMTAPKKNDPLSTPNSDDDDAPSDKKSAAPSSGCICGVAGGVPATGGLASILGAAVALVSRRRRRLGR